MGVTEQSMQEALRRQEIIDQLTAAPVSEVQVLRGELADARKELAAVRRRSNEMERILIAQRDKPTSTRAGVELADFVDHLKTRGLRTARGEFVASDGTRMPYDFAFERPEQPKRKGADE